MNLGKVARINISVGNLQHTLQLAKRIWNKLDQELKSEDGLVNYTGLPGPDNDLMFLFNGEV